MLPRARMGIEQEIGEKAELLGLYFRRLAIRDRDAAMFRQARDYGKARRHALRAARIRRDHGQE